MEKDCTLNEFKDIKLCSAILSYIFKTTIVLKILMTFI